MAKGLEKYVDITRFRCMEVLFHILYYYWGVEYPSWYRGSLYQGSTVREVAVLNRMDCFVIVIGARTSPYTAVLWVVTQRSFRKNGCWERGALRDDPKSVCLAGYARTRKRLFAYRNPRIGFIEYCNQQVNSDKNGYNIKHPKQRQARPPDGLVTCLCNQKSFTFNLTKKGPEDHICTAV